MKYNIIDINHDKRTVLVSFKHQQAKIIFHECEEVDVESATLPLEDVQELHMLACEDEHLSNIFCCEQE
jgi:hypothetical protein